MKPTLDNQNVESSLSEIGTKHEAVMAGTNDDAIVVIPPLQPPRTPVPLVEVEDAKRTRLDDLPTPRAAPGRLRAPAVVAQ